LSPLKHPLYRAIFLSFMLSNLGNTIQAVGAAWLLTEMGEPADIVALVQTAAAAPLMLFALPAGAFADMHDRRAVMLTSQAWMFAISLILAAVAATHHAPAWAILALTFAIGSAAAFFNPALSASTGSVVPRSELPGAVALNVLSFNTARSVGPAIGGAVVAIWGSSMTFVVNGAAYLALIIVLLFWRPKLEPAARQPILKAIGGGLRFVIDSKPVRVVVLRALTFTLAGGAVWALMPLVARDLVHGGSIDFGLLLGALGVGAVIGAATSTGFRKRFPAETLTRIAGIVYGLCCLVVAAQPGLWPTLAILVVGGAFWVQALSGFNVAAQLWTPRAVVGRVMAIVSSVTWGGLALSAWLWGHIASNWGVATAIAGSGAVMLVLPLIGLVAPMPRHEDAVEA
jgi:MFS family permease